MIVVATEDFELYHEVVTELRARGVTFTTIEPEESLPERSSVVLTDPESRDAIESGDVPTVVAPTGDPRRAVEDALTTYRGDDGRTVIGVDPGRKPGIAVLVGSVVVAAFQVPLSEAVEVIERETGDAPDAIVRVGNGSRLQSARVVNDLEDVRVELVDETGTTPYLGTGARGVGDILAAVNIARREGEPIDNREIEPTVGELQRIKDRSRERSEGNRAIDEGLARRVAAGELTVDEALSEHHEAGTDEE